MQRASFGNNKLAFDSKMECRPSTLMQLASFCNNQEPKVMQQISFGSSRKRSLDSNMDFQPPKQRQCMGLEHFSPMGAPNGNMQSLLAQSWQQVAKSARPMSRLFPTTMEPAATRSSNQVAASQLFPTSMDPAATLSSNEMTAARLFPTSMDPAPTLSSNYMAAAPTGSPRSTCDSPLDLGERKRINDLMLDVVSNCLSQRSLPLGPSDYHPLFLTSH